jgi:hypothetical protein
MANLNQHHEQLATDSTTRGRVGDACGLSATRL